MSARIVLSPVAAAQLEAARDWWSANRPLAPTLLVDELESALATISALPRIGRPYACDARPGVRRVLLRRSRQHLFYAHDAEADVVEIAAVWGAERGGPPPL